MSCTVLATVERRYVTPATFLRAQRHYAKVKRRVLAYIVSVDGWALVIEATTETTERERGRTKR